MLHYGVLLVPNLGYIMNHLPCKYSNLQIVECSCVHRIDTEDTDDVDIYHCIISTNLVLHATIKKMNFNANI